MGEKNERTDEAGAWSASTTPTCCGTAAGTAGGGSPRTPPRGDVPALRPCSLALPGAGPRPRLPRHHRPQRLRRHGARPRARGRMLRRRSPGGGDPGEATTAATWPRARPRPREALELRWDRGGPHGRRGGRRAGHEQVRGGALSSALEALRGDLDVSTDEVGRHTMRRQKKRPSRRRCERPLPGGAQHRRRRARALVEAVAAEMARPPAAGGRGRRRAGPPHRGGAWALTRRSSSRLAVRPLSGVASGRSRQPSGGARARLARRRHALALLRHGRARGILPCERPSRCMCPGARALLRGCARDRPPRRPRRAGGGAPWAVLAQGLAPSSRPSGRGCSPPAARRARRDRRRRRRRGWACAPPASSRAPSARRPSAPRRRFAWWAAAAAASPSPRRRPARGCARRRPASPTRPAPAGAL